MPKYGMVIDVTRCDGCYNCFIACRDERDAMEQSAAGGTPVRHSCMGVIPVERGSFPKVKQDYVPVPCPTSGTAAAASPDPARPAPRSAREQLDWTAELQTASECSFCAHLLDAGWKEPRCVEACPTGTLIFGDLDDPDSEVSKACARAEAMHPEYKLGENLRYIGLPRNFVAGAVVFGDIDECAEGVEVTLKGADASTMAVTNAFGDFEFEDLPNAKDYTVTVAAPGYDSKEFQVRTNASIYLGDIILERTGASETVVSTGGN